jgi:hypothetical protein
MNIHRKCTVRYRLVCSINHKAIQDGNTYASQMMCMQSMFTNRHLVEYHLHEHLEGHLEHLSFTPLLSAGVSVCALSKPLSNSLVQIAQRPPRRRARCFSRSGCSRCWRESCSNTGSGLGSRARGSFSAEAGGSQAAVGVVGGVGAKVHANKAQLQGRGFCISGSGVRVMGLPRTALAGVGGKLGKPKLCRVSMPESRSSIE